MWPCFCRGSTYQRMIVTLLLQGIENQRMAKTLHLQGIKCQNKCDLASARDHHTKE